MHVSTHHAAMNATFMRYMHSFSALAKLEDVDGLQADRTDDMRLLLGVHTNSDPWSAHTARDAHRKSWMGASSRIMCTPSAATPFADGCSVVARFVLGYQHSTTRDALAAEEAAHRDFLWIKCKTLQEKATLWLLGALKSYPYLTHIGKVDADTYVSPSRLIRAMAASNATADPNQLTLAGHLIAGADGICGTPSRRPRCRWYCPPSNCSREDGFERAGCWLYAQVR